MNKKLKAFALEHRGLLKVWHATFGKLKTKYYFGAQ